MLNIYLWLSTATGIPKHTSSVGVPRDIDAIWKLHLTCTAWDKWERNLCHSRLPCKECFFLKISSCFDFICLWCTKMQTVACHQNRARGGDTDQEWHGGRIGRPQPPPLIHICKWVGPSLRRQLCYAHPPTGSSETAFPWLPGKSWLPSCLPELPPSGDNIHLTFWKLNSLILYSAKRWLIGKEEKSSRARSFRWVEKKIS